MPPFRICCVATALVLPGAGLQAAENGLTVWLPGQYGSFAATPSTPGPAWVTVYYHSSVESSGGAEFPRGGEIDVGLQGRGNLVLFGPTYTFANPVLNDAQLSLSLLTFGGRSEASVDATLSGPDGSRISGSREADFTGFGDLIPQAILKWNDGVHNTMAYVMGDIPVGAYDPERLANIGIGHGAIDAGGGYTYFNPDTGREFSVVSGLTYNFENPDTDYRSGVVFHVDWGASQFLNEHVFVGAAGYFLQQLTADDGSGAVLGDFKTRVAGIGPQAGFLFPVADGVQGALNVKAYWEFAAENRPEGWNLWASLAFSPAARKTGAE